MYMYKNILRLKNNEKYKRNKNRGGECGSWERSTSSPCSTYSDIVLTNPLSEINYCNYVCGRMG